MFTNVLNCTCRRREERKESESEEAAAAAAAAACAAATDHADEPGTPPKEGGQRPRRSWEQWSSEDKATFFEGLCECGKNFELLEAHFRGKATRHRGNQAHKTRDQIRTFYYRTWHKISPHLDFKNSLPPELQDLLKKSSRELYGLINYGELRKRLGGAAAERNLAKLHELVFRGHATVRARGKNHQVRTPICMTLKRLSSRLEAGGKRGGGCRGGAQSSAAAAAEAAGASSNPVPGRISLELRPLTSNDFDRIHGCFQNPHVEVKVDPTTRLGSLMEQLEKKWELLSSRTKFQVTQAGASLAPSSQAQQQQQASSSGPGSTNNNGPEYELWMSVLPGAKMVRPVLTPVKPVTSATLCLDGLVPKLGGGDIQSSSLGNSSKEEGETKKGPEEENEEKSDLGKSKEVGSSQSDSQKEEDIKTYWFKNEADCITLGELFLMLGCSAKTQKMSLCYGWKEKQKERQDGFNPKNPISKDEKSTKSPPSSPVKKSGKAGPRRSFASMAMTELARKLQQQKIAGVVGGQPGKNIPKSPGANGLLPTLNGRSETTPTKAGKVPEAASNSTTSPKNQDQTTVISPNSLSTSATDLPTASGSALNVGGGVSQHEFRKPADPPPQQSSGIRAASLTPGGGGGPGSSESLAKSAAFKAQLAQILPKFSNRRGRPLSRKNVISRQLMANRPLQPKAYVESPNGSVRIRLLQNSGGAAIPLPPQALPPGAILVTQPHPQQQQQQHHQQAQVLNGVQAPTILQGTPVATIVLPPEATQEMQQVRIENPCEEQQPTMLTVPPQISIPEDRPDGLNPPRPLGAVSPAGSLSSLFNDTSLSDLASVPEASATVTSSSSSSSSGRGSSSSKGDHFLDCVLENSNSSSVLQTPPRQRPTPPSSPSRVLAGELLMSDLSMSSFFTLGDSPAKSGGGKGKAVIVAPVAGAASSSSAGTAVPSAAPVLAFSEDSSHSTSSEVDRQLLSMMTENSVDFTAKFSKLAAHVSSEGD